MTLVTEKMDEQYLKEKEQAPVMGGCFYEESRSTGLRPFLKIGLS